MADAVVYQTVYLWQCPHCETTWQLRHRPRSGADLVCAIQPEQRLVPDGTDPSTDWAGCAGMSVSAGRRGGIAPNVYV